MSALCSQPSELTTTVQQQQLFIPLIHWALLRPSLCLSVNYWEFPSQSQLHCRDKLSQKDGLLSSRQDLLTKQQWNISVGYTGGRSNNCPDLLSAFWTFTSLLNYKIDWYKAKTIENVHMEELRKPAQPQAIKPSTQTLVDEAPSPSQSLSRTVSATTWQKLVKNSLTKNFRCAPGLQMPQIRIWLSCMKPWGLLPLNLFWRVIWVRDAGAITHVSILCIPLLRILRIPMYSIRSRGPCQLLGWFVSRVFFPFLNFSALHAP